MIVSLMALAVAAPPVEPVVFACEHHNSPHDTDGVGSSVDLRAVLRPSSRWTLQFKKGSEMEAVFSWVDEARGIGRMEWQEGTTKNVRSVQFVPGSDAIGRPTFWLSTTNTGQSDAPGYICNGISRGKP